MLPVLHVPIGDCGLQIHIALRDCELAAHNLHRVHRCNSRGAAKQVYNQPSSVTVTQRCHG